MDIRLFAHSWLSDWNHGNAHFLRGWAGALVGRGHRVRCYEAIDSPWGGWSLAQLWREPGGAASIARMRAAYPELEVRMYALDGLRREAPVVAATGSGWVEDWERELRGAELVIAHEWNPLTLFTLLLAQRRRHGFRLLLHDTHHRALSQPEALGRLPIRELDGVLAFGESLRRVYERWGARRSYTLHEAADTARFRPLPPPGDGDGDDLVWIGNWGDGERTAELEEFFLTPAAGWRSRAYGVRYPAEARERLRACGIAYGGYLANLAAPAAYAAARLSVHVPRRPYAGGLSGIPTIRVFEALACGAALISAPWEDAEALFTAGSDYLIADNGVRMEALGKQLLDHPEQRKRLGEHGRATIVARHSCAHRARELEAICHDLD
jgi:spore maturation protein CgeB